MRLGCLLLLAVVLVGGTFACVKLKSRGRVLPQSRSVSDSVVSPGSSSGSSRDSEDREDKRVYQNPLVVCDSWFGSSSSSSVRAYGEGLYFDGVPLRWDGAGRPVFVRLTGSAVP